ncbi:ATP synthase subunit I [bacterium]|nr:ATP synthase subunit I [bacterium]
MNHQTSGENEQVRVFVRTTQKTALLAGTVIGAILSFFWSGPIGYGFLSGVGVSVINFQLMAVDAYHVTGKTPDASRKYIIGRFIIRFAIMFGFISLIVTRTDFNVFAAFAGLFFVQVILIGGRLAHMARLAVKTSKG